MLVLVLVWVVNYYFTVLPRKPSSRAAQWHRICQIAFTSNEAASFTLWLMTILQSNKAAPLSDFSQKRLRRWCFMTLCSNQAASILSPSHLTNQSTALNLLSFSLTWKEFAVMKEMIQCLANNVTGSAVKTDVDWQLDLAWRLWNLSLFFCFLYPFSFEWFFITLTRLLNYIVKIKKWKMILFDKYNMF